MQIKTIKVNCPHCDGLYEVERSFIGQELECPGCENTFLCKNPNLQECTDCFRLISKHASFCPHCGCSFEQSFPSAVAVVDTKKAKDTKNEETVINCNPSAKNYIFGIVFGILTISVGIGLLILIYIIIQMKCTKYTVTNKRIIVEQGLIGKIKNEIWIQDMRGVNILQGISQRIFGVGNILIGTAASAGTEITIHGIANPQEVVNIINSLRD